MTERPRFGISAAHPAPPGITRLQRQMDPSNEPHVWMESQEDLLLDPPLLLVLNCTGMRGSAPLAMLPQDRKSNFTAPSPSLETMQSTEQIETLSAASQDLQRGQEDFLLNQVLFCAPAAGREPDARTPYCTSRVIWQKCDHVLTPDSDPIPPMG